MNSRTILFAPLSAALALLAAGCGGSGTFRPDPKVRFVNAFPGVPTVKAAVGDTEISSAIAYGEASDYKSTNNDNRILTVGQVDFTDLAAYSSMVYRNDRRYTGIGYGGVGSRTIALLDVNEAKAPNARVSLRLFDALSAPASVDVYITTASAGDALPATPSIAGVLRGTASNYYDLAIGPGSTANVRIRVYAAGDRITALEDRTLNLVEEYRGTAVAMDAGADNLPLVIQDNN